MVADITIPWGGLRRALCYGGLAVLASAAGAQTNGLTDINVAPDGSPRGLIIISPLLITPDGLVMAGSAFRFSTFSFDVFRVASDGNPEFLGNLFGQTPFVNALSADGRVIVGGESDGTDLKAFRWTRETGIAPLVGTLGGARTSAFGVSANGAVAVGEASLISGRLRAVRWDIAAGTMADLGTLGGFDSSASGVSADGFIVVGTAATTGGESRAFRWSAIGNAMSDLGTLGGNYSSASGVSADGAVVVGNARTATSGSSVNAFRWTSSNNTMVNLGTLGGLDSEARAVSANGAVVVGGSSDANGNNRAFRWSRASGMQSVENWLRAAGVNVPTDITQVATSTNGDGSIVVGTLANTSGFIARVAPLGAGGGLITVEDLQSSLITKADAFSVVHRSSEMVVNGAHSRPFSQRVPVGLNTFWVAGDLGRDDHSARDGAMGMAEVGVGRNFGAVQWNVALGTTYARQGLAESGETSARGAYLFAEALMPLGGPVWASLGGYYNMGRTDMRRGYDNAGAQDFSQSSASVDTFAVRTRLQWEQALRLGTADISSYLDLMYGQTAMDGYTESGGGFPARFDGRREQVTEVRFGLNAEQTLGSGLTLLGTLEAVHRLEKDGRSLSGEVMGLFPFALRAEDYHQTWVHSGAGVQGKLGAGMASLMLHATTKGESPNVWLAANWNLAF